MMQDSKNNNNGSNGSSQDDKAEDNIISFAEMRRRERESKGYKPSKPTPPPMINLPPVTKAFIILNLVIFAITQFGGDQLKIWTFMNLGFIPARFSGIVDFGSSIAILSPVTHMFLHAGWLHIGMNVAMLAAFGAGVEKAFGVQRYIAFYIACGLLGALGHTLLDPASTSPVVGASGAISGLFAAILIVLQRAGGLGQGKYGLWPFIALWCGLSFLFAATGGMDVGDIAWAAHLGGFLGGFALMRLKYFKL